MFDRIGELAGVLYCGFELRADLVDGAVQLGRSVLELRTGFLELCEREADAVLFHDVRGEFVHIFQRVMQVTVLIGELLDIIKRSKKRPFFPGKFLEIHADLAQMRHCLVNLGSFRG